MPKLDSSQDSSEFGTRYPSPYIEKIYLKNNIPNDYDEDSREGLEIVISFYCQAVEITNEEGDVKVSSPSEVLESFSETYVIAAFIIGDNEASTIINDNKSIYKYLYKYSRDVDEGWDYFVDAMSEYYKEGRLYPPATTDSPNRIPGSLNHSEWQDYNIAQRALFESGDIEELPADVFYSDFAQLLQNFVQISVSDFMADATEEVAYIDEETGTTYYKFTNTMTIPLAPGGSNILRDITTFEDMFSLLYDSSTQTYRDLEIFTLTTSINWNELANAAYGSTEYDYYIANETIAKNLTSRISYENVFKNSLLNDGEQLVYVDLNQNVFSGIPMLDPDGTYRAIPSNERNSLIEGFTSALTIFDAANTEEQEVLDSYAYILSTEGQTENLIVSIRNYLLVFPYKDADTPMSGLYGVLSTRLSAALGLMKSFGNLTPKLIRNIKIIDGRVPSTGDLEMPSPSPTTTDGTINNDNRIYRIELGSSPDEDNKGGIYRVLQGESGDEVFEWEEALIATNYGWFWFDYEKSLRNDTGIASVFDIDKLEDWFGKEFTNSCLTLKEVSLKRYFYNLWWSSAATSSDFDLHMDPTIITNFWDLQRTITSEYGIGSFDGHPASLKLSKEDAGIKRIQSKVDDTGEGTTTSEIPSTPSSVLLRNTLAPSAESETDNDYRLMCFQFNDYYDASTASEGKFTTTDGVEINYENYRAYITLDDTSYDVIRHIIDTYRTSLDELQEYYEAATDTCSFSSFDGDFTSVFVNMMSERYADNPQEAPWILAPLIYNLHRDLVFNTYGGSSSMIVDQAALVTDKINPTYGTLEQVENFLTIMNDFYNELYYAWDIPPEEVLAEAYSRGTVAEKIYTLENTELIYTQCFPFLMPAINSVESEEDYLEESMTAEAYGYMSYSGADGVVNWAMHAKILYRDAYSRNDLVEFLMTDYNWWDYFGDGEGLGYIKVFLDIIDGLKDAGYGDSTIGAVKQLLKVLLAPSGLSLGAYYTAVEGAGGLDAGTLDLVWYYGAINNSIWQTTGAVTSGGVTGGMASSLKDYLDSISSSTADAVNTLASSDLGLHHITGNIMKWVWPAANETSDEYGTDHQISDFYDILGIDDDYKS